MSTKNTDSLHMILSDLNLAKINDTLRYCLNELSTGQSDMNTVAAVIEKDLMAAAWVMKNANVAMHGRSITSVRDALVFLGLKPVSAMLFAMSTIENVQDARYTYVIESVAVTARVYSILLGKPFFDTFWFTTLAHIAFFVLFQERTAARLEYSPYEGQPLPKFLSTIRTESNVHAHDLFVAIKEFYQFPEKVVQESLTIDQQVFMFAKDLDDADTLKSEVASLAQGLTIPNEVIVNLLLTQTQLSKLMTREKKRQLLELRSELLTNQQ